ncbi:TPA: DUF551 domain-containing protein [Enterobacter hormaechei]
MSTITKELAKLFRKITNSEIDAEGNAHVVLSPADSLLINNARIALASLEAEASGRNPVLAYADSYRDMANQGVESIPVWSVITDLERNIAPLFTAPPAPVSVPDEVTAEDCPAFVKYDITEVDEAWALGFNQCRDAMLQGAEQPKNAPQNIPENIPTLRDGLAAIRSLGEIDAGKIQAERDALNSPVAPDGWVACSDKNPEKGRWLALFGKRTKENCDPYVDEGYLGSDGEFYFFDWESGPRIDDCHPYDKAIVSHWMYWELPAAPQQEVNNGD